MPPCQVHCEHFSSRHTVETQHGGGLLGLTSCCPFRFRSVLVFVVGCFVVAACPAIFYRLVLSGSSSWEGMELCVHSTQPNSTRAECYCFNCQYQYRTTIANVLLLVVMPGLTVHVCTYKPSRRTSTPCTRVPVAAWYT